MILIIDDDSSIRKSLALLLKRAGYDSDTAPDADEALAKIRANRYGLIIMDMNFGLSITGREGIELLMKAKIFQPDTPVILITAWGSIELAVEGMRAGAYDFITKPWNNRLLLQRVETALSLSAPGDSPAAPFRRDGIIGNNRRLLELLATAERVAPTDAPVLILGENGTGKELIANAIHINSKRRDNPFVMVNLGGVSQSLFESEMFGHAKGAFTDAVSERKGRFEMADHGTIFLDEIGDLDLNCQVKLLRVLQQHTFERLGESRPRKVDIRVVCATNAPLDEMVAARTFREDLYYRINLITLRVPALRERRDDIPLLVRHFVREASRPLGREIPEISAEAMEWLTRLPYPGNIRQLKNMVDRAVLIGGDRLGREDFAPAAGETDPADQPAKPSGSLDEMERKAITDAIAEARGNLSQASRALGLTRQALYRRMLKYGIDNPGAHEV